MEIDLGKRLEELKMLNTLKDKLNNKIKFQLINEENFTQALTTFHKPVTEKLEPTKQLALPENNKSNSKQPAMKKIFQILNHIIF